MTLANLAMNAGRHHAFTSAYDRRSSGRAPVLVWKHAPSAPKKTKKKSPPLAAVPYRRAWPKAWNGQVPA